MLGDLTDLQQRHHPYNIPCLLEKVKGFPLVAKSFRNTATYKKLKGGSINPPHPLYHGGGKTLRVCPRVSVLDLRKVKVTSVGSKDSKRRNFSSKGGRAHTGTIFSQTSSKQSTSFDFWVEQKNVGVFMPKHLERIWPACLLSFLTCP